jgi:hypothetical protein
MNQGDDGEAAAARRRRRSTKHIGSVPLSRAEKDAALYFFLASSLHCFKWQHFFGRFASVR